MSVLDPQALCQRGLYCLCVTLTETFSVGTWWCRLIRQSTCGPDNLVIHATPDNLFIHARLWTSATRVQAVTYILIRRDFISCSDTDQ